MKVWEVRLSLSDDGLGNWKSYFKVESDGKEYELTNGAYYESGKIFCMERNSNFN